ncbi:MAG: diguanylate cyclase [Desulfobacterales bacterium]|nr:diguanylate cyclase [Desulfobacterales bacterium]
MDHTQQKRLEEALRRERRERFRNLSLRDNLTGLFNTRYLYQALDELCRGKPHAPSEPFSLIFMDMDNFKQRGRHPRAPERQPGAAGGRPHHPLRCIKQALLRGRLRRR